MLSMDLNRNPTGFVGTLFHFSDHAGERNPDHRVLVPFTADRRRLRNRRGTARIDLGVGNR